MYLARLRRLRASLADSGLDAFIISNPHNIFYLSGFDGVFDGDQFYLLVTPDEAILPVDFRYLGQARESVDGFEIVEWKDRALKEIAHLFPEGTRAVGYESASLTVDRQSRLADALSGIELKPEKNVVETLRIHKDKVEIDNISAAAALADAAFEHAIGLIEPGVAEREIATEIEYFLRRRGADETAFKSIVASGKRSAFPHGRAGGKPIGATDLIIIDLGARFENYCSDMTRTVVLGEPSKEQRRIFDVVLKAQAMALESVSPGVSCREIDALARNFIAEQGYAEYFGHGLGHGVGLEVHERPSLSPKSEDVLEEGMVITIEPGIYVEGLGGVRVEDLVLVTEDGIRVLSHAPKLLLEL